MNTSKNDLSGNAEVRDVRFAKEKIVLILDDDREIALPLKKIKWLKWLSEATPKQRASWTIEPHGYAVWWNDLDDGIELIHALNPERLPLRSAQMPVFAARTA